MPAGRANSSHRLGDTLLFLLRGRASENVASSWLYLLSHPLQSSSGWILALLDPSPIMEKLNTEDGQLFIKVSLCPHFRAPVIASALIFLGGLLLYPCSFV